MSGILRGTTNESVTIIGRINAEEFILILFTYSYIIFLRWDGCYDKI